MISNLSEHPTNKSLVFLDACFSGGARKEGLVSMRGVKIKPKEENLLGHGMLITEVGEKFMVIKWRNNRKPYLEQF